MSVLSRKLLIPEPREKHTGKKMIPVGNPHIHPPPLPQDLSCRKTKSLKGKWEIYSMSLLLRQPQACVCGEKSPWHVTDTKTASQL